MNTKIFEIDFETLKSWCLRFAEELKYNRKSTNDGKMAIQVLEDVKRRGQPTEKTKNRLLVWCYTEGNQYQGGVELARAICIATYGRLLPDPDKVVDKP